MAAQVESNGKAPPESSLPGGAKNTQGVLRKGETTGKSRNRWVLLERSEGTGGKCIWERETTCQLPGQIPGACGMVFLILFWMLILYPAT